MDLGRSDELPLQLGIDRISRENVWWEGAVPYICGASCTAVHMHSNMWVCMLTMSSCDQNMKHVASQKSPF